MARLQANSIAIEYEATGPTTAPVVLLIMGLGMQLVAWPDEFVAALEGGGYRVLRFDNRDAGLSQQFDERGVPNLAFAMLRYRLRLPVRSAYRLEDMADDAVGLLDALNIDQAHIVGVSMGGMIAQLIAARAPHRCLSLCSIMSSSGARGLPGSRREALAAILSTPRDPADLEQLVEHYVRVFRVIGSPGFPTPPARARERLQRSLSRGYHPRGTARQIAAIIANGDRTRQLRGIRAATLVIHGADDPLVPKAAGRDTAAKIPRARLLEIDGMGHDLAPGLVPILSDALQQHFSASRT